MKTFTYALLFFLLLFTACTAPHEKVSVDYTTYVNPFIGTDFTGNTYPGAQAPFGMVQLSPDNGLPGWEDTFTRTVPLPDSAIPICREQVPATCMIFLSCP